MRNLNINEKFRKTIVLCTKSTRPSRRSILSSREENIEDGEVRCRWGRGMPYLLGKHHQQKMRERERGVGISETDEGSEGEVI